jgi:hypothetical protein
MLSLPVALSWHQAPRRMASATRRAIDRPTDRWPGSDWNSPAPVRR